MKRFFKHKKNIIFSFLMACMLFIGVGVSVPKASAKAADSDIDISSYEWANYWNMFGGTPYMGNNLPLAYSHNVNDSTVSNITDSMSYDDSSNCYSYGIDFAYVKPFSVVNIWHALDVVLLKDDSDYLMSSVNRIYPLRVHDSAFNDIDFSFSQTHLFDRTDVVANVTVYLFFYDLSLSIASEPIYEVSIDDYVSFPSVSLILDYYGTDSAQVGVGLHYIVSFQDNCADLSGFAGFSCFLNSSYTLNADNFIWSYTPYFYSEDFSVFPDGSSIFSSLPVKTGVPSFALNKYYNAIYNEAFYDGYTAGESTGYEDGYTAGESTGYEDGYTAGESTCYAEGYADGIDQSIYGFLGACSVKLLYLPASNNPEVEIDISPTRIYGGFDFSNIITDYAEVLPVGASSFQIKLVFDVPIPYSTLLLNGTGVENLFSNIWTVFLSDAYGGLQLTWDNIGVVDATSIYKSSLGYSTGSIGHTDLSSVTIDEIISSSVSILDYFDGFTLTVSDFSFENGYDKGYYDGEKDGYVNGVSDGLSDNQQAIYNEGHRVGFDDGFAKGYAENNSFLGLFTAAIDAPVLTFTSMLDFEILGYNMKAVVLSLLSVALVICLIRLFAKGGST